MKTPLLKKHTIIKWNIALIFIVSIVGIFIPTSYLAITSTLLISLLIIVLYLSNKISRLFGYVFIEKKICPYYNHMDCPYETLEKCPYDTGLCHRFKKEKRFIWNTYFIIFVFILSILCSLFSILIEYDGIRMDNLLNSIDLGLCFKVFAPIANSLIAAIMCAYMMDIPSRMFEYQEYFIKLLSSSDYLKTMEENDLIKLHSKIIRQLHAKDVPYMPESLIEYDDKILDMLKHPYFKEYIQTVNVSKKQEKWISKTIKVKYTAFNPYFKERQIRMDIGLANSLRFEKDISKSEAKNLFKIKRFTISIDGSDTEVDLLPYIKIQIVKQEEVGLKYNGKVILAPIDDNPKNSLNLDKKNIFSKSESPLYELVDFANNKMYIEFKDKIRVYLEYEIVTPENDLCYTKRLRYPVKYFHLDYSVDDSVGCFLNGQLIGTMLDQQDVSTETMKENKRICLHTHNWLLPKNGAVIVHCYNRD